MGGIELSKHTDGSESHLDGATPGPDMAVESCNRITLPSFGELMADIEGYMTGSGLV